VRFGDLDGDGVPDMLIAQNIPRNHRDTFDQISCLTAVTLDGKVLWQKGRPDPRNGLLTNDTPFQIHDIDGDGHNEVIVVRDFHLQILDGRTGEIRNSVLMPNIPDTDKERPIKTDTTDSPAYRAALQNTDTLYRPYENEVGDNILFVNFSGNPARHEILVKDRYMHFWIYNNKLELLWKADSPPGHYPYPFDINGDGFDELLAGATLWDHTGHQIWSNDAEKFPNADSVMMGNLSADTKAEPRVYESCADQGFLMFDIHGKLLKHLRVGFNQSASVGKYRMDIPGLQYISVNFWRSPGIVTLFDWDGNILSQEEPIHSGSELLPVNWRGDGQEFVLLNGNTREGGMIDGRFQRVVMFPDDGHPDLAAAVLNVTGDPRDEIILWDQQRVWIYTQDRPFTGHRIYNPIRNPDYNDSNYRTDVSLPRWVDVK
jgi:hypothetical protein